MIEREVWGMMDEKKFHQSIIKIEEKLGKFKIKKRLSIEVSDWNDKTLDTRIRITDGNFELMQKVGAWKEREKEEIQYTSKDSNKEKIFELFRILKNYVISGTPHIYIYQYENYVIETEDYELKLSHQFGNGSKYSFEVEAFKDTINLDKIAKSFELEIYSGEKDQKFWDTWNKKGVLNCLEMSDEEIKSIISKYIE